MESFSVTITIVNEDDGPALSMKTNVDGIKTPKMAALVKTFAGLIKGPLEVNFNTANDLAELANRLSNCSCDEDD